MKKLLLWHIVLFCIAGSFFSIVTPMGNVPSDTEYSIATAESLVHHGSPGVAPTPRLRQLRKGVDQQYYSRYGIGYAVLFVPAVVISDIAGTLFHLNREYVEQVIVSFCNTILASLILVLFYDLFGTLGYSHRISLVSIAGIGCASILLPYSKIIHSEIPATVVLLLFVQTVIAKRMLDVRTGLRLGVYASLLMLFKPGNICYAVIIALYGLWLARKKRSTPAGFLVMAGAVLITGFFMMMLNKIRYGSLFDTGYGTEQFLFTTPLITGLAGLLLSPSKSMFLFSPLTVICTIALPRLFRRWGDVAAVLVGLVVLPLLFYAKWHDWHGGWSWGPRLIVPSIILLHLSFAECIIWCKTNRAVKYVVVVSAVAGCMINIPGSLVWYQQIYHFHQDYTSVARSHPAIALKLLVNKVHDRDEVYSCSDYGLDCKSVDYEKIFHVNVRNDSIGFSGFEKFQGLAVMWDGVHRNFNMHFLWCIPCGLLLLCLYGCYRAWNFVPERKSAVQTED